MKTMKEPWIKSNQRTDLIWFILNYSTSALASKRSISTSIESKNCTKTHLIAHCAELSEINFESNKVKELHQETFIKCNHIQSIAFDSNQIKNLDLCLSFDQEPHDECKFWFSNNFIQRFPFGYSTENNIIIHLRNNVNVLSRWANVFF